MWNNDWIKGEDYPCNDQYCFSMLQKMIAERLSIEVGTYYHFAHNLHIYNDKLKF